MKVKHITLTMVFIITSIVSINAQQQEEQKPSKTKFSIEIDPATFGFKGYGFHLRIQPKNSKHVLVGIGTYAMDLPDVLVDFNKKNKGKSWDIRLNQGYSIFGEYHFKEVNHKWFVGTQLGLQEYKIKNKTIVGSEKFNNQLIMGYIGYTIKPFKNSLYIKPWLGIGYTSKISGKNTLGTAEYHIDPIAKFATLHIGYTF